MNIQGIEGLTHQQLQQEIARGGRFVVYEYCISLLIITLRRSSDVHFVRANEGLVAKGLSYTLLTFLMGWWGFPWGPIYTITSLTTNLKGGREVTGEVLHAMRR